MTQEQPSPLLPNNKRGPTMQTMNAQTKHHDDVADLSHLKKAPQMSGQHLTQRELQPQANTENNKVTRG